MESNSPASDFLEPNSRPARAIIIGATGFTGRLIALELRRQNLPVLVTGRDPARLEVLRKELIGVDASILDLKDHAAFRRHVRPGDVVVNCAGPFSVLGDPVIRAAIETGAHYLDTTGEQEFIQRAHDRWNTAAISAGVVVVNAMAFEYALGNCAASLLVGRIARPLRSIDVIYDWDAGAGAASMGTRRTTLEILSRPVLTYDGGGWRQERIGSGRRSLPGGNGRRRYAINFPLGEVVTIPRRVLVEQVRGWFVVGRGASRLARLLSPVLSRTVRTLRPLLDRVASRGPEGPSPAIRHKSEFSITIEARPIDGPVRQVTVSGRDPYGLTAVIAAAGVRSLLGRPPSPDGHGIAAGVLDPSQIVDPEAFLAEMESFGVAVRF